MRIVFPGAALLTAAVLFFAAPALALHTAPEMYSQARRLSGQGLHGEAVELLGKLHREFPDDPVTNSALFEIGRIQESFLGDYQAARQAYALLIERFPDSRNARRAGVRLARLEAGGAGGDEPLRLFNEILQQYSKIGSEQALIRARKLYAGYPDFSRRDHVLFWIAEEEFRRRDYAGALEDYRLLLQEYPQSKWAYFAASRAGKAHIELRQFAGALSAFEKLAALEPAHPGAREAALDQIRLVQRFRFLRMLYFLGLGFAGAAGLLWLTGTRWRTLEAGNIKAALVDAGLLCLLYAMMVLAAARKLPAFQPVLIHTGAAVCAAAFLNTLFVSSRPFSLRGRIFVTLVAFLAVTSIIYASYYRFDTVNLLYDSLHNQLEEAHG